MLGRGSNTWGYKYRHPGPDALAAETIRGPEQRQSLRPKRSHYWSSGPRVVTCLRQGTGQQIVPEREVRACANDGQGPFPWPLAVCKRLILPFQQGQLPHACATVRSCRHGRSGALDRGASERWFCPGIGRSRNSRPRLAGSRQRLFRSGS